jgi:outer membrane biosynthesis protein TonB
MAPAKSATEPPARAPRHPGEDSLAKGVRLSVIAHAVAFATIFLKAVVFPGKSVPFVPTLRVDLVGLPDVLKKDLVKTPAASSTNDIEKALKQAEADARKIKAPAPIKLPDKPVEKAAPDEMVVKPKVATPEAPEARGKKLKSALDRIKALERIKGEVEQPAKSSNVIKGNKVSHGASLSGDAKEAPQATYYDLLREKLQENWALPVWIARQQLSAQVLVFIDARGRLASYRFTKPSGNSQFDDAVKRTLTESQPYPAPPADIAGSGVLVGFPL